MKQPHIKVELVHRYCIVSGNPDRVDVIASLLVRSNKIAEHRGLVAYEGYTPETNTPVTILTTGMGGPTTAIVMEEAYKAGGRAFIRIGSCGSLIPNDPIGTIYIPQGAVRAEGVSSQLIPVEVPALASTLLVQSLIKAASDLTVEVKDGLVVSSDIYYSSDDRIFNKWTKYGVNCVEMESQ